MARAGGAWNIGAGPSRRTRSWRDAARRSILRRSGTTAARGADPKLKLKGAANSSAREGGGAARARTRGRRGEEDGGDE